MLNRRVFQLLLSGLCFFTSQMASSQDICVQVIDEESNPLENVTFQDLRLTNSYMSDGTGLVCLPSGEYTASLLGYFTKDVTIDRNQLVVTLTTDPVLLNGVIVNDLTFAQPLIDEVATVSILPIAKRNLNNTPNYALMMNSLPGVFMHSGAINTNRLIIRGVGARSSFDTEKVRAYLANIPLTNGSGQTTIEDLDLNLLGSMEIIKGPASSQYGNSLAGTLLLHPQKTTASSPLLTVNLASGSFGFNQGGLLLQKAYNKHSFMLGTQGLISDGYRDNNESTRESLIATHKYNSKNLSIYSLLYAVDQFAEIPSSLSASSLMRDRRQAAFTWGSAQGYEDYRKVLAGTNLSYNFTNHSSLHASIFTSHFSNYEPRPFNILAEETFSTGTRNRYIYERLKSTWIIGNELFVDVHEFQTFENLYRNNDGNGSPQGAQISDLKETRAYINLFTQYEYRHSTQWKAKAGLNINKTTYNLEDFQVNPSIDLTGQYDFDWIISPSLSLSYQKTDRDHVFSSLNHGFSPPTLEETLTPEGLLNPAIVPETGLQWEVGYKRLDKRGHINTSLYSIWIQDLLVSRRTAEDQFVGLNAGSSIHQGIEVESSFYFLQTDKYSLTQQLNASYGRFQFVNFEENGIRYDDNNLPGVPQWKMYSAWEFTSPYGFLSLSYQGTGEMYVDDANTIRQDDFHIVGSRIGKEVEIGVVDLRLDLTINNLFNTSYNSMLLVNAVGFGGNGPRYFYPALPRNYLLSLSVKL